MRHPKKRLIECNWVRLNSITNETAGRKHYEISVNDWKISHPLADIRAHFDPAGNRGSKIGTKWKFGNRKQAEQFLTLAILRFGA